MYKTFVVCFSIMSSMTLISCNNGLDFQNKLTNTPIYQQLNQNQYGSAYSVIAHGGGGEQLTSEERQTNSRESIIKSIEDGKKLIEIDFQITSDGVIVGSHHWLHTKERSNYSGKIDDSPLSLSEFKQLKLRKNLTPIDIFEINDIFKNYPDLILVTDKITNYKLLTQQFIWLDRLIVECFDYDECLDALDYGILNVALNIKIDIEPKLMQRKISLLKNMGIRMTTFNAKAIRDNQIALENAKQLRKEGFVNLVYTSNDPEFIQNSIGVTASAIYTDVWSVKSKKCNSANCNTY